MKVDFNDNIKDDIIELINLIPCAFNQLKISKQIDDFENLNIRITDKTEFQCEIAFNNTILISELTIEMIWCMTYAHLTYYNLFCKGIKPDGQFIEFNNENWNISKEMLSKSIKWFTNNEPFSFSNSFPRTFRDDNEIGIIFKYALLFFLSHELFHVKFNGNYSTLIDEENKCDIEAIKLILNASEDKYYLYKAKGICVGLMILNIYGVHTNNYDGKSHPYSYDRLINNLKLFFGKENDKIWGLILAIFALHMTQKQIKQPRKEFDNFYDCIIEYKRILKKGKT